MLLVGAGRWLDCKRCGTRVSLRRVPDAIVGYTGAYAFANVLLTMAGSAILLLYGTGWFLLVMLIAVGGVGLLS